MSRLESMVRRLKAQIEGLNWAIDKTKHLQGDILEMGLGNGRSYDHLRENSDKRIWVIDRILKCHPDCVPPEADFLQGEAEPMLQRLADDNRLISLAHYDFGFGNKALDVEEAARLSPLIAAIMEPGGIVVSQQPLTGMEPISGPDSIAPDRYLFYRK